MIVFRRGNNSKTAPPLIGMERVTSLHILGVTITDNLRTSSHVSGVLGACSCSLHALRVLRAHGLPEAALHEVTRATTIARLLYASPAWWGYTTAGDRYRLSRFLHRVKRMGYLSPQHPDIDRLMDDADCRLLQAITRNPYHVLRSLFQPIVHRPYVPRVRPHDFELPKKDDYNFVSRVLFRKVRVGGSQAQ